MKRIMFLLALTFPYTVLQAQDAPVNKDESWKKIYRAAATKINDLVDTRLEVRFDYEKTYMYGKAWITLKPHYYPTDSLSLDAKGAPIEEQQRNQNRHRYADANRREIPVQRH